MDVQPTSAVGSSQTLESNSPTGWVISQHCQLIRSYQTLERETHKLNWCSANLISWLNLKATHTLDRNVCLINLVSGLDLVKQWEWLTIWIGVQLTSSVNQIRSNTSEWLTRWTGDQPTLSINQTPKSDSHSECVFRQPHELIRYGQTL